MGAARITPASAGLGFLTPLVGRAVAAAQSVGAQRRRKTPATSKTEWRARTRGGGGLLLRKVDDDKTRIALAVLDRDVFPVAFLKLLQ